MAINSQFQNPYVGPRPFEREEKNLFFGREREISDLQSLLTAHRTLLLYAASGAGKTSLLNAGLLPLPTFVDSDRSFYHHPPQQTPKRTSNTKRPPKVRTPNHTRLNLGQEKILPSIHRQIYHDPAIKS